ncbi:MAG: hypothetical protein H6738_20755 [Alphaproteobacteria bacterium]|nr:hypothetical protein [Alphaproteobacteria bacterium]MCB9699223.1 hypothetical protein [Alphaproteobacteria bacterium]
MIVALLVTGCGGTVEPPPVQLTFPLPLDAPLPCAARCAREEAARVGVQRAIAWLAEHTPDTDELRVDLPIMYAEMLRVWRSERLSAEQARMVAGLDSGTDPRRRAWDPSARLPDGPPTWTPTPGQKATPNYALVEALYCPERGMRPEASSWVCAELRDGGGVYSGHAAWIEAIAVGNGCLTRAATCLDELRDELVTGALAQRTRTTTLERDEFGEQILFACMAGADPGSLAPAVDLLLSLQTESGSFGAPTPEEPPWYEVHATLVGAAALSSWLERSAP